MVALPDIAADLDDLHRAIESGEGSKAVWIALETLADSCITYGSSAGDLPFCKYVDALHGAADPLFTWVIRQEELRQNQEYRENELQYVRNGKTVVDQYLNRRFRYRPGARRLELLLEIMELGRDPGSQPQIDQLVKDNPTIASQIDFDQLDQDSLDLRIAVAEVVMEASNPKLDMGLIEHAQEYYGNLLIEDLRRLNPIVDFAWMEELAAAGAPDPMLVPPDAHVAVIEPASRSATEHVAQFVNVDSDDASPAAEDTSATASPQLRFRQEMERHRHSSGGGPQVSDTATVPLEPGVTDAQPVGSLQQRFQARLKAQRNRSAFAERLAMARERITERKSAETTRASLETSDTRSSRWNIPDTPAGSDPASKMKAGEFAEGGKEVVKGDVGWIAIVDVDVLHANPTTGGTINRKLIFARAGSSRADAERNALNECRGMPVSEPKVRCDVVALCKGAGWIGLADRVEPNSQNIQTKGICGQPDEWAVEEELKFACRGCGVFHTGYFGGSGAYAAGRDLSEIHAAAARADMNQQGENCADEAKYGGCGVLNGITRSESPETNSNGKRARGGGGLER